MTLLHGTVKNGVIVLENGSHLADGTQVDILAKFDDAAETRAQENLRDLMLRYAGIAKGLPSDFAKNLDHYIHGAPRRPEKE